MVCPYFRPGNWNGPVDHVPYQYKINTGSAVFPQMKPEKKASTPKPEDFIKIGVPQEWLDVVMHEYYSVTKLREDKATQVHQKLNGIRKKNKLPIAALQLEEVERWF